MNKNIKLLLLLFALLIVPFRSIKASETGTIINSKYSTDKKNVVFDIINKQNHYYIDTKIGDDSVRFMLESGTSFLLMSEEIYEKIKNNPKIKFNLRESKTRILAYNDESRAKYRGHCMMKIGNMCYDGPVIIGGKRKYVELPIQHIKHAKNKTRHITIDLQSKKLIIHHKRTKNHSNKSLNFTLNSLENIIVNLEINFTNYKSDICLSGDYMLDLGNANVLFLNSHNTEVNNYIALGKIKLDIAKDKQGNEIGKGIFAQKINILGNEFKNMSIGITKHTINDSSIGYIGFRVFARPVTFDFEKNNIYFW